MLFATLWFRFGLFSLVVFLLIAGEDVDCKTRKKELACERARVRHEVGDMMCACVIDGRGVKTETRQSARRCLQRDVF
jgi:hypothetical protein